MSVITAAPQPGRTPRRAGKEVTAVFKNGLSYAGCIVMMLLSHAAMLGIVLVRGNYDTPADLLPLVLAVLGLDLAGIIAAVAISYLFFS